MPVMVDGEEYYTVSEACEYLGGISSQTLRLRARANGIQAYKQGISRNVYYKKSDLDRMKAFRPIREDEEDDS
jgi:excisionase family DNA binding protein